MFASEMFPLEQKCQTKDNGIVRKRAKATIIGGNEVFCLCSETDALFSSVLTALSIWFVRLSVLHLHLQARKETSMLAISVERLMEQSQMIKDLETQLMQAKRKVSGSLYAVDGFFSIAEDVISF